MRSKVPSADTTISTNGAPSTKNESRKSNVPGEKLYLAGHRSKRT